jgi:SNF2 family DNA or RNA helicase
MKLFAHQQEALQRGIQGNVALFHDCGCGKTLTALQIINHLRQTMINGNGKPSKTLVVCPLSIIETAWIADCRQFTPELSVTSLWSRQPKERLARLHEQHDIYICNYETFKNLYDEIKQIEWSILIVDESSKLKNPRSQTTRAILSFAGVRFRRSPYRTTQIIPHRYVLSGTPAPNDESEYWGQMTLVAPGEVFHPNFYAFRGKYFHSIPLGLSGQKMFRFRNSLRQEFMDAMKPSAHIVRKQDALDLPEQIHQTRLVHLSQKEQTAYDKMKKDLVLEFGKETILARHVLTEIMKLRQLTSGFAYGEEGTYQIGKSKLNELSALLDEIGNNQVIIWCNFRAEIAMIRRLLPDSDCIPNDDKPIEDVVKCFRDGGFRCLIANPASAGHGLTFTNCSYATYFSLNYSYELFKQSQDRIHRIGQKLPCTYYYLIADGTIDEVILKTLEGKRDLSQSVLAYLKGKNHQQGS